MNEIAKKLFPEEAARVEAGQCAFDASHDVSKFRDEVSRREYRISGMCQECQDKTFGV